MPPTFLDWMPASLWSSSYFIIDSTVALVEYLLNCFSASCHVFDGLRHGRCARQWTDRWTRHAAEPTHHRRRCVCFAPEETTLVDPSIWAVRSKLHSTMTAGRKLLYDDLVLKWRGSKGFLCGADRPITTVTVEACGKMSTVGTFWKWMLLLNETVECVLRRNCEIYEFQWKLIPGGTVSAFYWTWYKRYQQIESHPSPHNCWISDLKLLLYARGYNYCNQFM